MNSPQRDKIVPIGEYNPPAADSQANRPNPYKRSLKHAIITRLSGARPGAQRPVKLEAMTDDMRTPT